jgi:catechol 2,3-dioxygenase-like lactoylglutathione lyase family enzyme
MRIDLLDHLILTVADLDATVACYTHVLGMKAVTFGAGRTALVFGNTAARLHQYRWPPVWRSDQVVLTTW